MRWRFAVWGLALALGLWVILTTARVTSPPAKLVTLERRGAPERLVLVFIDSLTHEVATNAGLMPELGRLARQGASFEVEPCRDQLTYLCLRAALTGHDESSLLAVADNFRPSQEGPPATLLSAATARGLRVSVIGTADFHPYRRALLAEHALDKHDETPERVLGLLGEAWGEGADLVVVSLGSGDMTAHVHGTRAPEYAAAFRRIDAVVGAVAASLGERDNLVVFGDHGHDVLGRHLPGTSAKTFALYRGAPFRPDASGRLHITDHRALLGVLLGLATEASYRGPALPAVFRADWLADHYAGRIPALGAPASRGESASLWRWLSVAGLTATFVLLGWLLGLGSAWPLARGALGASLAATAVGVGYDSIRRLVHDHGDSPERALCLLVPLGLGVAFGALLRGPASARSARKRPAWVLSAALSTVLVTFGLLLPTAYYYGSRRAVVLAAALGIALTLFEAWRRRHGARRERVLGSMALLLVVSVLLSLYQVEQLGPQTAGAASWRLASPLYLRCAWLPLLVAKLLLIVLVALPRVRRAPFDAALAGCLVLLGLFIELGGVRLPREAYAACFVALLLGLVLARRVAAASLFAGALLLQVHLFGHDSSRLAAIELIVAGLALALWAWPRLGLSQLAEHVSAGLSVALGLYLMLWPTVGFHLAGIDFGYMFQWIPEAEYERYWQLIGLGLVIKLALPLVLVLFVARPALGARPVLVVVSASFCAKVALLALLIAAYAATHDMRSEQALAMLAELSLLLFVVCTSLLGLPSAAATLTAAAASEGWANDVGHSAARTLLHRGSRSSTPRNGVAAKTRGPEPPRAADDCGGLSARE